MGRFTQDNPAHSRYQPPAWGKPKSFSSTIQAHKNKAWEEANILLLNMELMGKPYEWAAVVRGPDIERVEEYKRQFKLFHNRLSRRKLTSHISREENEDGLGLHHHITFKDTYTEAALRKALEASLPDGWRIDGLYRINCPVYHCNYVFTADIEGDKYGHKRKVFRPRVGFYQSSTVGPFWEQPKPQLRKEVMKRAANYRAESTPCISDNIRNARISDIITNSPADPAVPVPAPQPSCPGHGTRPQPSGSGHRAPAPATPTAMPVSRTWTHGRHADIAVFGAVCPDHGLLRYSLAPRPPPVLADPRSRRIGWALGSGIRGPCGRAI